MARGFHDLTPDEKSAFRVWEAKLADHTLSETEHAECRRKLDELLWKGPSAQVEELKAKVERLQDMLIHALNENLRTVKALITQFDQRVGAMLATATVEAVVQEPLTIKRGGQPVQTGNVTDSREPCEGLAPCGQFALDPTPPHELTTEEKTERRGRPKGAKNKPKTPPVPSGEGAEQPAVTVAADEVTAEAVGFPEGSTSPPAERSYVDDLFGIG